jgi:DNA polymerase
LIAADVYQVPVEKVTKAQRKTGKLRALSCAYQTGVGGISKFARQEKVKLAPLYPALWAAADGERREKAEKRFAEQVKRHDPKCDLLGREGWIAAELIKVGWRAQHPGIVAMWKALEQAAIDAVANPGQQFAVTRPGGNAPACTFKVTHGFLWMRLPSGRCLAYGKPKMQEIEAPWADKTLEPIKREKKLSLTARGVDAQTEKWTRFPLYGGSFFNNLVQGSARDVLVNGMINAEAAGFEINLHTHDEMGAEIVRGSRSVEEFESILCELPDWCGGLPMKAAGFTSKRYRK